MTDLKIVTTGWTKEQVEELERVIERNTTIAENKVKLQRVRQGAVFIPAPEEHEVVKSFGDKVVVKNSKGVQKVFGRIEFIENFEFLRGSEHE